jgi:hypothetical protein
MKTQEKFRDSIFLTFLYKYSRNNHKRNILNFEDDRPRLTNLMRANFFSVKVSDWYYHKILKKLNPELKKSRKFLKLEFFNKNKSFVRFSLVFETSSKDSQINFPSTKYLFYYSSKILY